MAMHPKFKPNRAELLLDLIFPVSRAAALKELHQLGLSSSEHIPNLQALLPEGERDLSNLVAEWKIRLDSEASQRGLISTRNAEIIIGNLLALGRLDNIDSFDFDQIRDQTILDYGSGVFYALSSAIILRGNGFSQVYALEPYPLRVEFVVSGVLELLQQLMQDPARFCFSGIPERQLKMRVAELDLSQLTARLQAFNSKQCSQVELGGVTLVHGLDELPAGGVDWVFSNSVLEHVENLPDAMQALRALLKPNGVCLHTVDFADHRHYEDPRLHLFEMYFDGVLHEINGMRPREMEQQFVQAGFSGYKHRKLSAPVGCFESLSRNVLPNFAQQGEDAFSDWVNGYILRPA